MTPLDEVFEEIGPRSGCSMDYNGRRVSILRDGLK
jgi:hypothetical protein